MGGWPEFFQFQASSRDSLPKAKPSAGQTALAFAVFIAVRSFHPAVAPDMPALLGVGVSTFRV